MKFEDMEQLQSYHETLNLRCMYEVYRNDWPLKMCIDFDHCVPDSTTDDEFDEDLFAQLLCKRIIEPLNATINCIYGLAEWPVRTAHWMIALSSGWSEKDNA